MNRKIIIAALIYSVFAFYILIVAPFDSRVNSILFIMAVLGFHGYRYYIKSKEQKNIDGKNN